MAARAGDGPVDPPSASWRRRSRSVGRLRAGYAPARRRWAGGAVAGLAPGSSSRCGSPSFPSRPVRRECPPTGARLLHRTGGARRASWRQRDLRHPRLRAVAFDSMPLPHGRGRQAVAFTRSNRSAVSPRACLGGVSHWARSPVSVRRNHNVVVGDGWRCWRWKWRTALRSASGCRSARPFRRGGRGRRRRSSRQRAGRDSPLAAPLHEPPPSGAVLPERVGLLRVRMALPIAAMSLMSIYVGPSWGVGMGKAGRFLHVCAHQ